MRHRAALFAAVLVAGVACSTFEAAPEPVEAGAGQDASASDSAGAPSDAGATCPSGRGPAMVLVDIGPTKRFCVDSTEVTRAQYTAFLDDAPPIASQASICAWNKTFTSGINADFTNGPLPAVGIDWCDALAFCTWAGKRLCGSIADGGALPFGATADPGRSEWMVACSRNGNRKFSYGQNEVDGSCNVNGAPGPAAVGSYTACQGGYDGIFDMVGNVDEWENACDDLGDGGKLCANRGGSFRSTGICYFANSAPPSIQSGDWGFRCCADAR